VIPSLEIGREAQLSRENFCRIDDSDVFALLSFLLPSIDDSALPLLYPFFAEPRLNCRRFPSRAFMRQ
jgi:hypothetical protein